LTKIKSTINLMIFFELPDEKATIRAKLVFSKLRSGNSADWTGAGWALVLQPQFVIFESLTLAVVRFRPERPGGRALLAV
jgi:hypothetical protein